MDYNYLQYSNHGAIRTKVGRLSPPAGLNPGWAKPPFLAKPG